MQRPSVGELLRGLREGLAGSVLPTLPRGVPQQQLKAALHLIGRLEKSWDLSARHLAQDNEDIAQVLAGLLPTSGAQSLGARLASAEMEAPVGYNDPELTEAAARNCALHGVLLELPDSPELIALYARMADRDAIFVGDRKIETGATE